MNFRPREVACGLILLVSASNAVAMQTASTTLSSASWPTDFTARLEATELLQSLNVGLLTSDNKKQTLERWGMSHRLVSNPQIAIERVLDAEESPTEAQRKMLATSAKEPVRHRKVRVLCSAVLLDGSVLAFPCPSLPEIVVIGKRPRAASRESMIARPIESPVLR